MNPHDELDFVLELDVDLQALKLALANLYPEVKLLETVEVLPQ